MPLLSPPVSPSWSVFPFAVFVTRSHVGCDQVSRSTSHPQIQFISTGNNSGLMMQPGTSGFDMGARFDGRSECSVCLKGR